MWHNAAWVCTDAAADLTGHTGNEFGDPPELERTSDLTEFSTRAQLDALAGMPISGNSVAAVHAENVPGATRFAQWRY